MREGPIGLRAARLDEHAPPRVGYAIGRSVGSAPIRNRLRRRIRETVRANTTTLRDGYAYLFDARPEAAQLGSADVATIVARLLARAQDGQR
ncbi:MAG: ribonuclease P protein component [Acidimicrobiia bacterium]